MHKIKMPAVEIEIDDYSYSIMMQIASRDSIHPDDVITIIAPALYRVGLKKSLAEYSQEHPELISFGN